MEHLHTPEIQLDDGRDRSLVAALKHGVRSRCPSCGETKLFSKGLAVMDECYNCKEELHHHRADDLPAYLNIFIVGHVVVAAAMILMGMDIIGTWPLVVLACSLAVVTAVLLMRPLKGLVVGAQWALRMHGFGGHDD